ncbi:phosphatase [Salmonella enterica subsp. enterica serovar Javiana]|nr:phosphatase [Salmonella enterica]EBZ7568147.1 phosphatase [Salmonella enterica subsp. enterica serovar Javiana]ECG2352999.1 phosphatase [Salmonella enterica subsp. enterica serovar Javiana]EDT6575390.1 phosphatase [Salmonella enterica subsp. enterica]EHB8484078.1 phosphatase [Salmonella enterica]
MPTDGIITLNLEKIMTARVIALDLDGTLLTPHKTLLPSSLDALSRAKALALALETPAICCNGTYLYK